MIQPCLLYYVNHVFVILNSIFEAKFTLDKEGGLYQNKVTLSLTFTQRLGHQAHNCKMAYWFVKTVPAGNAWNLRVIKNRQASPLKNKIIIRESQNIKHHQISMCPLYIKLINILTVMSGVSEGSVGSLLYLGIFPGWFLILLAT